MPFPRSNDSRGPACIRALDKESSHSSDKWELEARLLYVGKKDLKEKYQDHAQTTPKNAVFAGSCTAKCLKSNGKLLCAFLELATHKKHRTVLRHLQLHFGDQEHDCSPGELTGVLQSLSTDCHERQAEVRALVVAAHAFREFSTASVNCIIKMDAERRESIFKLVQSIPEGTSKHVFVDQAFPDSYLMYFQLLRKMGFGRSGHHLEFSMDNEDVLHAGIVALNIAATQ